MYIYILSVYCIHIYIYRCRSISLPETFALSRVSCLIKHFLRIVASANCRLDDVGGELGKRLRDTCVNTPLHVIGHLPHGIFSLIFGLFGILSTLNF